MTRPRLSIDSALFDTLIAELARRGDGRRESGAFLLTARQNPQRLPQSVTAVAYYDDLDPASLTGMITFGADGYTALAARCRRDGLRVVADIHTHPGRRVAQSLTDATHPMLAVDGHVALIAPHYAHHVTAAADLGVHVREHGRWTSSYGPQAAALVCIRRRTLRWHRLLPLLTAPWRRSRRTA